MMNATERWRQARTGLAPSRRLMWMAPALLALFLLGGGLGRVLAVALLPRLLVRKPAATAGAQGWRDAAQALAAGLSVALACHLLWAPALLTEGQSTGSDVAEHFWLLHSMRNPGWHFWSLNRYPLPALVANLFAFTGNPHDAWLGGAFLSMMGIGAGLWLWGRAIAGAMTGWITIILVGSFPDLVLLVRTVSSYPEIIACGCLASGLCAYALRHPGTGSALLAGLGVAAVFASDSRGLVQGLVLLPLALVAAISVPRHWLRRGLLVLVVAAPVYGSWLVHNRLPVTLHPLENTLEGPIERSYTRLGSQPPVAIGAPGGWSWGDNNLRQIPASLVTLARLGERLNPEISGSALQRGLVERHIAPLASSVTALALAGLLLLGGHPPWRRWREPKAWFEWLDWRGRAALLLAIPYLAWTLQMVRYEYASRFFAQATPGLALLAALGLTGLAGRDRPRWGSLVGALLLLFVVPNPLHWNASWHSQRAGQRELGICLERSASLDPSQALTQGDMPLDVFECVKAQSKPLQGGVASPWATREDP